MPLARIVAFVEVGPWCGTRIPGFHRPRPGHGQAAFGSHRADQVALNPQPLPPLGKTGAPLWQAVGHDHRHAHGGEYGKQLQARAAALIRDQVGAQRGD